MSGEMNCLEKQARHLIDVEVMDPLEAVEELHRYYGQSRKQAWNIVKEAMDDRSEELTLSQD